MKNATENHSEAEKTVNAREHENEAGDRRGFVTGDSHHYLGVRPVDGRLKEDRIYHWKTKRRER